MTKKKKIQKNKALSTCCNVEAKVYMAEDFLGDNSKEMRVGTCYYVCSKCEEACNTYVKERKTWAINPKTRRIESKKKEYKLTRAEIEEIRKNEDF